jgi:3-methyl-2-oxobutanoate hydroxymethyltransferase
VKRANTNCKIIADIPYQVVYEKAGEIVSASKKLLDCGADIVKLEIEDDRIEMLKKLTAAQIPVCTHIGYTPQTPNLKAQAQGKTIQRARELVKFAMQSQEEGAQMIVLELIPTNLAKYITQILDIATIGIGSGQYCGGQVQVWCDIAGFSPKIYKHSKLFADAKSVLLSAFENYVQQVKSGQFPTESNAALVSEEIIEELKKQDTSAFL